MTDKVDKIISGIQAASFAVLGAATLYFVNLPQSQWQKEADAAKNKGEALKLMIEAAKLPEGDRNDALRSLATEHFREQVELQARAGFLTKNNTNRGDGWDSTTVGSDAWGSTIWSADSVTACQLARANISRLEMRRNELSESLRLEIAGLGTTGIPGTGPVATSIKNTIGSLQAEINSQNEIAKEKCKEVKK